MCHKTSRNVILFHAYKEIDMNQRGLFGISMSLFQFPFD